MPFTDVMHTEESFNFPGKSKSAKPLSGAEAVRP